MNKKKMILNIFVILIAIFIIGFCSKIFFNNSDQGTESESTETTTIEPTTERMTEAETENQESTNGGIADTANNTGGGQIDLLTIFSMDYYNEETMEVDITGDMIQTLGTYGIVNETHYVNEIISFIYGERSYRTNMTNEQLDEYIKTWIEAGRRIDTGIDLGESGGNSEGSTNEGGSGEVETTQPAETEPAPTEPVQTQPEPTEPAPTEPEQTQPAPTEPANGGGSRGNTGNPLFDDIYGGGDSENWEHHDYTGSGSFNAN